MHSTEMQPKAAISQDCHVIGTVNGLSACSAVIMIFL